MDDKNANVSFTKYDFGHIAHIIKNTEDILKDVMYSIGLSRTSERTLLRTASDNIKFIDKVMQDSKDTLKDIKYIAYYDLNEADPEGETSVKCCCKEEA